MNMIKRRFWVLSILLAVVFTVVISFAFSPVRSAMADGEEKESAAVEKSEEKIDPGSIVVDLTKNGSLEMLDFSQASEITEGILTSIAGKILVWDSMEDYDRLEGYSALNPECSYYLSFSDYYFSITKRILGDSVTFCLPVLDRDDLAELGTSYSCACYVPTVPFSNLAGNICKPNDIVVDLNVSVLNSSYIRVYDLPTTSDEPNTEPNEPATPHGSNTASGVSGGFGDFDFSDISSVWEDSDVVTKVISVVALCGLVVFVCFIPSLLRKRKR